MNEIVKQKKAKSLTTNKKMKIIGKQSYINPITGEINDMLVVEDQERDFNFSKVWVHDLISRLDDITNQKIKVANYIIDNLNRENLFIGTQRQIAAALNTSLVTVNKTLKILIDNDVLKRKTPSVYVFNPELVWKGGRYGRLNILNVYKSIDEPEQITNEKKLKNIDDSIKLLESQRDKLQADMEFGEKNNAENISKEVEND